MQENDEEIKKEPAEEAEGEVEAEVKAEVKEEPERVAPSDETAEILLEGKTPLEQAEYYIAWKRLDEAQELLNKVHKNSAKKHYLQSLIYKGKFWYSEQRKALKKAIKAEPDNEDYKKELEELEARRNSPEYKRGMKDLRKNQMGQVGGACGEACCEGCCYGICTCICEGIGNGC